MTLRELSRYYELCKKLERNREMLASLESAAAPGAQALSGMPHPTGVSDKTGKLATETAYLKERISSLEFECAQEKEKIEQYIETIQDDQTRMIFRLRFIYCMAWEQVAFVIGGKNTAGSVKKVCYRYLGK